MLPRTPLIQRALYIARISSQARTFETMRNLPEGVLTDTKSLGEYIQRSNRVLALLGAGLSASSGLPTFRGAGGLWRNHDAVALATPEAFSSDPALVWQFYSFRRHMALQAQPNKAHYALAEYAMKNRNFITLSQNVDGEARDRASPTRGSMLVRFEV